MITMTISDKHIDLIDLQNNYLVEWWFFQGNLFQADKHRFDFMLTFFRINVALKDEPRQEGFSILLSLLDLETHENFTLNQIDDNVMKAVFRRIEHLDETELDRDLINLLYSELKKHGPPKPIVLADGQVEIIPKPFEIKWNDVKIKQLEEEFLLEFSIPGKDQFFSLLMKPVYSRIVLESLERDRILNGQMGYATYPRLSLTGYFNNQKIGGNAWFDHQWGDHYWFVTDEKDTKILGWDWFGINLDDGTDIILSVHKKMKTNEVLLSNAFVHYSDGELLEYNDVIITPIKFWESPKTHIKYPLICVIKVPKLNLELNFTPLIDDQEIQVIGSGRAIWEGAGRVSGKINGKEITGRARGEFHGYGYIFDFQNYLQTLADRVDKRIEEFFPKKFTNADVEKFVGKAFWQHEPEAYSKMLSTPVWDLISRRGKRWRPIFGILMVEALGVASLNYEASACLAELVHSGALIIDDIEDDSLLRRGEQCLHLKYGLDVAINAGNTLYFLPSVELFNHKYLNEYKKLRIHEIMMKTYLQAHFGQTVDIYWSRYLTPENLKMWLNDSLEEKILQLYDYKTAAGAKGLAEVAAVIAEVDENTKQVCIDFARSFAVAFQIIDDIHNFSDSPKWTKVCGEDIECGKLTYLIVRAIRKLDLEKSNRLIEILCSPELRKQKEITNEAVELVRNSGAIEECKEKAKQMSLEENDRFCEKIPSCEPKIMLSMLCLKMLELAYDT